MFGFARKTSTTATAYHAANNRRRQDYHRRIVELVRDGQPAEDAIVEAIAAGIAAEQIFDDHAATHQHLINAGRAGLAKAHSQRLTALRKTTAAAASNLADAQDRTNNATRTLRSSEIDAKPTDEIERNRTALAAALAGLAAARQHADELQRQLRIAENEAASIGIAADHVDNFRQNEPELAAAIDEVFTPRAIAEYFAAATAPNIEQSPQIDGEAARRDLGELIFEAATSGGRIAGEAMDAAVQLATAAGTTEAAVVDAIQWGRSYAAATSSLRHRMESAAHALRTEPKLSPAQRQEIERRHAESSSDLESLLANVPAQHRELARLIDRSAGVR